MKYWENIIEKGLSFEEAMEKSHMCYVTRPDWEGFHFKENNVHYILLKTGEIITVEDEDIQGKDKNDWILVSITQEACDLIDNTNLEKIKPHCDFCSITSNEEDIDFGNVQGEELLKKKDGTYAIYNCWNRGGGSLLENVKYCPYCGGRLGD